MSNESINIWSHIIGFFYFSFLLIYDNFLKIPYVAGSTLADYLVFSALLIGFQVNIYRILIKKTHMILIYLLIKLLIKVPFWNIPVFQLCMLFSAGYHVFCCHSEQVFHRWFALDLAGISLGLCTCYIPSVYYAFYCHTVSSSCWIINCLNIVPVGKQRMHFITVFYWHILIETRRPPSTKIIC